MNEHIQAAHGVKRAAQAFEITGEEIELAHVQARLFGAALSLVRHRLRNVAGVDGASAHLC